MSKTMKLTERDFEILKFLNEMRFASLEVIYLKFFHNEDSKSQRYAQERMQLLVKNGFVKPHRVYTSNKNLYTTTKFGCIALQNNVPEEEVLSHIESIDFRFFEHDQKVTIFRVLREKEGRARNWVSERKLISLWGKKYGIAKEFIPDGLYESKVGERVAFELELTLKATSRIKNKVLKYLEIMNSEKPLFKRTLYVTNSEKVRSALQDFIAPYPDRFQIEDFDEVIKKSLGNSINQKISQHHGQVSESISHKGSIWQLK